MKSTKIFKIKVAYFKGFDTFVSKLETSYSYSYYGYDISPAALEVMRPVGYGFITVYPKARKVI